MPRAKPARPRIVDRFADVRGVVAECGAGELIAPGPAQPGVCRALDPVAERASRRGAPDVFHADDLIPRLGTKRAHDLAGPESDGRAVGPHGRDVGAPRHLGDLVVGHPGPDDAPRHVHATHPLVVEDLRPTGDDGIHRGVFGPRHVPEQPDEGVEARGPGASASGRRRAHRRCAESGRRDRSRRSRAPRRAVAGRTSPDPRRPPPQLVSLAVPRTGCDALAKGSPVVVVARFWTHHRHLNQESMVGGA